MPDVPEPDSTIVPDGWGCGAPTWGDGPCDCGCGEPDPDCPERASGACDVDHCAERGQQVAPGNAAYCVDPGASSALSAPVNAEDARPPPALLDVDSGCASAGRPGDLPLFLGVALLLLGRRRRR